MGIDRYMQHKIFDSIAISNSAAHPDILITITCNPYRPEIQNELLLDQRADEVPDLCDSVFRMKLKLF